MKTTYKVKFNLGRGDNYMKWKVIGSDKSIRIFDPEKGSLVMRGCKLINKKGGAKKIYNGANKFVVAWILCDSVEFIEDLPLGS